MERKKGPKKEIVTEQVAEKEIVIYDGPKVFRWKKLGGGSLRLPNKIIKPGEVFTSTKEALPVAFLDSLQCLDEVSMQEYEAKKALFVKQAEIIYSLKETEDGKWNVVNPEGKPINDQPLSKVSAEELLSALEA
jgi:hypothetical protein